MKKSILNLGKALSTGEQQQIQGGNNLCRLACYSPCYAQANGDRIAYAACLDECFASCD